MLAHHRRRFTDDQLKTWIDAGMSYCKIAERIGCDKKTVRTYVQHRGWRQPKRSPRQPAKAALAAPANVESASYRGYLSSLVPDPERDALANGDSDPERADQVLRRRYEMVRAARMAAIAATFAGDDED